MEPKSRIEVGHSRLYCHHCEFSSLFPIQFSKHSLEHGHPAHIVCPFCTFRRPNTPRFKYRFKDHLLTHLDERLVCTKCTFSTKFMKHFLRHIHGHSSTYACPSCSYTSKYKDAYKEHSLRHLAKERVTSDPCLKCPACFEMSSTHGETVEHVQLHVANEELGCATCEGKVMLNGNSYKRHMFIHHLLLL
ncbi:RE1-silencing transcription factor B [Hyalella azteca]|uniref:RE1-silencing transcription factor B n=1 Tax=Hyalella azteca TaxID=294128 RepID=A0A8B7NWX1_HYAAZ|nr:RE1-silencing transcription factor B [Hyalella azteca]